MSSRPTYIVFAGVNGAGKSTFYYTDFWREPESSISGCLARVNPDEILRDQGGDWSRMADQIQAGKAALRAIEDHFAHRRSFTHETTLAGRKSLLHIERARELGYRIVLFYVGVDDAKTALGRIEHRVSVGGHDINEKSVRRRYFASLSNLSRVLDTCDSVYVYDNTVSFRMIAQWADGVLCWWGGGGGVGSWLTDAMCNELLWRPNE